jgi:hypothetical protein
VFSDVAGGQNNVCEWRVSNNSEKAILDSSSTMQRVTDAVEFGARKFIPLGIQSTQVYAAGWAAIRPTNPNALGNPPSDRSSNRKLTKCADVWLSTAPFDEANEKPSLPQPSISASSASTESVVGLGESTCAGAPNA